MILPIPGVYQLLLEGVLKWASTSSLYGLGRANSPHSWITVYLNGKEGQPELLLINSELETCLLNMYRCFSQIDVLSDTRLLWHS